MTELSQVVNDVVTVANEIAPKAPIVEAAEAAIATTASPTPENYVADIQLAINIIRSVKQHLDNRHASLWESIKGLF